MTPSQLASTPTPTPNPPFQGRAFSDGLRNLIVILGTIVLLGGVLGNVLLLLVMFKRRKMKRFRNVFIANLAMADLMVICCGLPFFLLDLILGRHPVVSLRHCMANAFILCVSYAVSVMSLMLVSFHRYVKVCHPRSFHTLFPPTLNRAYCAVLWLLAALANMPLFGLVPHYGYNEGSHLCSPRADRNTPGYGSILEICMLVVPVLLIGYFNACIFSHWRGSRCTLKKRGRGTLGQGTWRSFTSTSMADLTTITNSGGAHSSWHTSGIGRSDGLGYSRDTPHHHDRAPFEDLDTECSLSLQGTVASEDEAVQKRETARWEMVTGRKSRHSVDASARECQPGGRSVFMGVEREGSDLIPLQALRRGGLSSVVTTTINQAHRRGPSSVLTRATHQDTPQMEAISPRSLAIGTVHLEQPTPTSSNQPQSTLHCVSQARRRTQRPSRLFNALDLEAPQLSARSSGIPASFSSDTYCMCLDDDTVQFRGTTIMKFNTVDTRLTKRKRKKSLYPSIDRTDPAKFFKWRRRGRSGGGIRQRSADVALVRSLLVISVCLFLLYTPFVVTVILTFILKDRLPPEVPVTSALLLFVNCAINWLIYGVMNTAFRQAYVTTLKSCAPSFLMTCPIRSTS